MATSASRNLVMICSGLCFFLGIPPPFLLGPRLTFDLDQFSGGRSAGAAVEEVAGHDLTMKKIQRRMDERERRWDGEGLTYEERLQRIVAEEADPPADGIFPVDAQWALEWDEVEEDIETARCLRENPEEWMSRRS